MFQQTPGHTSQKFWNAPAPTFDQQQPFHGWWNHPQSQSSNLRPIANELIFSRSSPASRFDANPQDGSFDQGPGSESLRNRPIPSLRTRPLNRPKSPPKQRPEDQWQINVDTGRPIKVGGRIHKRIAKRKISGGGEEFSYSNSDPTTKGHDQTKEANPSSPAAGKEPYSKKVVPVRANKEAVPASARKDKKIQVDSWSIDLELSEPSTTFKY